MLVRNAEIGGERRDLRCQGDRIVEIAPGLTPVGREKCIDAGGGALLRGLHDHHIHLMSLAAALGSVACGPSAVENAEGLSAALANATPRNGWIRGAGYFESVAGDLTRDRLDELAPDIPVRIQHRSGAMWFVNSNGLEALGIQQTGDASAAPEGIERQGSGRPTGRLFRMDAWLRERLPAAEPPDLAVVGERLARFGVTGVTDATPTNAAQEFALLRAAQTCGALPQRLRIMGRLDLRAPDSAEAAGSGSRARIAVDAHKILLDEPALPDLDALARAVREAHEANRGVAIHTVTRAELVFALAALEIAGTHPGDRLEHASIATPEAIETIERIGLRVCTQPNFIAERGDAYQRDVAALDQPHLYRVGSWARAGVPLAFGTDAPFGDPDPWRAMRAAVRRETQTGVVLGVDECVSPESALALFDPARLSPAASSPLAESDQRSPRAPQIGDAGDLCLLAVPWAVARNRLKSEDVRATLCSGELAYLKV
ncbi:MAG: amidohydrolase family protein [Myxococcota bacterium]